MTTRAALLRHPLAMAGVLVTTVSAVAFIGLVVAALAGLFQNPYAGLVVFILVPALMVLGLLLVPLGMWLEWRRLRRNPDAVRDLPVIDLRNPIVRLRAILILALTVVNVIIILIAGKGAVQWMD
ncbi:MAG: cytochrome c3 family protein, partial [Vicinamibacterales bacterium]